MANFISNIDNKLFVTTTGEVGIGSFTTSDTLGYELIIKSADPQLSFQATSGAAEYVLTGSSTDVFSLTRTGTGTILQVASDGLVGILNDVGVGTIAPTSYSNKTLQISGGTSTSAALKITNNSTGHLDANGLDINLTGLNSYIYNRSAGSMELGTTNIPRITIAAGGDTTFAGDITVLGSGSGSQRLSTFETNVMLQQDDGATFQIRDTTAGGSFARAVLKADNISGVVLMSASTSTLVSIKVGGHANSGVVFSSTSTAFKTKATSLSTQASDSGATLVTKDYVDAVAQDISSIPVTVSAVGGGNKYFLNGVQQSNAVLQPGFIYRFDQSDASNNTHPLRFSSDSGNSTPYTTGVTASGTPGSTGAYTQINTTQATPPNLYYYCTSHLNMGGRATIRIIKTDGNATFTGDITLGDDLNFTTNGFADISNTGTGAMRFKPSSQTLALTLTGANATFTGDVIGGTSKTLKSWRRLQTDANDDWGLNNNAGSSVIAISAMGTPSTSTTTFAGDVIVGESASPEVRLKKTNAGTGTVRFQNDGSNTSYIQLDASEDMVYYGGASVDQVFYAGGVLNETKSGTLSTFVGKVGIGTTNPIGNGLTVAASTNGKGVEIQTSASTQYVLAYDRGAGTYDPLTVAGSELRFQTGNIYERMRIRESGTIGIGAAGYDSQMLTIAAGTLDGAIYATSTDANCFASFRDNSSTANIEYGAIGNNHVFRKDASEQMRIDSSGNLSFRASGQAFQLYYTEARDFITNNNATAIIKQIDNDATNARIDFTSWTDSVIMTIKNSGNVGINTTSPSRLLTIQDGDGGGTGGSGIDSRTKLLINSNTESYISYNVPALSFCGERYMIAGTTKASVELWDYAADPQFRISAVDSRPLTFATGNVEKMRISSSGTVTLAGDKTINTSSSLRLNAGGGTLFLDSTANIILRTGGTTPALTLDSSQRATFAGSIIFSSNTAYVQDYAIRKGSNALIFSGGSSGYYFNGPSNGVTDLRIGGAGTIFMSRLGGYSSSNADVRFDTSSKELYYQTSSKRYKTDIVNIESSLDKINLLRPVRYKDINTKKPACGLIAEETIKVIPEVVFTKEIEGFDKPQVEGINYADLVPFLIKSIQEQQKQIKELQDKSCSCNNCNCNK